MFPIQCRVFSSRRSLRFVNVWLLRFLLSVSDVQPDVLSASSSFCSIHTAPPPPRSVLSINAPPQPPPSHAPGKRITVCVCVCVRVCVCESPFVCVREREMAHLFQERINRPYSVILNKLLYFDRELSVCAFLFVWGAHANSAASSPQVLVCLGFFPLGEMGRGRGCFYNQFVVNQMKRPEAADAL